jgi:hypothetical protein
MLPLMSITGSPSAHNDARGPAWYGSALLQGQMNTQSAVDTADHLALPFQHRRISAEEIAEPAAPTANTTVLTKPNTTKIIPKVAI